MAAFVVRIWKEIVWIFSPKKFGDLQIPLTNYRAIFYPLPMAIGILSLRYILSRYCFSPFGRYLQVKTIQPKEAPPNPLLEATYKQWKKISHSDIVGLAKQTDMTERQIERWLRQRHKQDRPTILTKFNESCWKCTYYTSMFIYGLVILWNKPWFWDIAKCWDGFPASQILTSDIWWYYMISLSFYWSLFFGQFFFDVRRKDFWQMIVHHTVTIFLLTLSWLTGAYRLGSLVLVLHDCGDIFLEAAKIAKYADYQATCISIFCVFAVNWIMTRLVIYPLWIIKQLSSTVFDAQKLTPEFYAYYTFNALLLLLLVLHCFWAYLILKVAVELVRVGSVERDVRSSSDDEPTNE